MPKKVANKALIKKDSSKKAKVVASRESSETLESIELPGSRLGAVLRLERFSHTGPLPTAKEFALYNRGIPEAAKRILRMVESSQEARERDNSRGQILSFILALFLAPCVLATLVIVALYSSNSYAIVSLCSFGGIVALAGVLIYHRISRTRK